MSAEAKPEVKKEKARTLLTSEFLRELEALRRRLEVRARSGQTGEHAAKRRGGASEFAEHRAYAPGDDVRRVDWAAYARTDEPVLKLFRAEEDVIARVVCDGSASLGFGDPPKLEVAKRLAAAVAYMTLSRSERAQLFIARAGLASETAPARGRAGLSPVLRALEELEPSGKTDLARAIEQVVRRSTRPGLLAVVSDFFDAGAVLEALARAVQSGHDVALIQVVAPEEIEPALEGDIELQDAETGELVEVTMDAAAIEAYALRFAGLCEELRHFARRRGATYVRARTDDPLEPVIRRFVGRSVD